MKINFYHYLIIGLCSNPLLAFQEISPAQLYAKIQANDTTMVLIDVRTASEYNSGHIAKTTLHTWSAPTLANWQFIPVGKDVIVICQSGTRAGAASAFLDTAGHNTYAGKVFRMTGGMNFWTYEAVSIFPKNNSLKNRIIPQNVSISKSYSALGRTTTVKPRLGFIQFKK